MGSMQGFPQAARAAHRSGRKDQEERYAEENWKRRNNLPGVVSTFGHVSLGDSIDTTESLAIDIPLCPSEHLIWASKPGCVPIWSAREPVMRTR